MLPGPVLVMLRVLSWLSIPLWPGGIAAEFIFDDEGFEVLVAGAALAATIAALMLHMHDKMDERVAKGLAAQKHAQDALVHAVDAVAGDVPPPRRTTRPLRAVPDDA